MIGIYTGRNGELNFESDIIELLSTVLVVFVVIFVFVFLFTVSGIFPFVI